MLEGFITIVLVGSVMAIGIVAISGIYNLIVWQDKRKYLAMKKERAAALQVYKMVLKNVGGNLTLSEYSKAIKYTVHKYHLGDQGRIEFAGSDKWYLAQLITEAVRQNRMMNATYAIARADAEIDKQIKKQEDLTA